MWKIFSLLLLPPSLCEEREETKLSSASSWNYGSQNFCCPIVPSDSTKRHRNFQVILYSASWKFIKTQNSSKRRAHASLKFHVLWCNQIPDSSSRGLSEITLQHSKVTELSFIAMFLNNENIKISRGVRGRIYCKSMQMTAVCQARAIFPRTNMENCHQYAQETRLESIKASDGSGRKGERQQRVNW